jgi:hypothetical protein
VNRQFRLFWLGQAASNLGDAFAFVSMPLLVLGATHSVVQMGRVTAFTAAGQLVAATFSGYVIDRVHRRRAMILCDLARMLLFAALPLTIAFGGFNIPLLYFVAGLAGMASNLFLIGYTAAVKNLVEPHEVASANARLQASMALLYVVGSALAGAVCNRLGAGWALGVDSLSFAFSALSLATITLRHDRAEREDRGAGIFSDLRSGFAFLARHRVLRPLTIFQTAVGLLASIGLGAAVIDLIIYRLRSDFGADGTTVGVSLGFASLGAVFGAVAAARTQRRFGLGAIVVAGTGVQALGLLATGLAHGVLGVTVGGMLWAGGLTFRSVAASSLRQTLTPDALLGRVVAAGWAIVFGAEAVGAILVTRLAASIGAASAATCVGVGLAVVAVAGGLSPLATESSSSANGKASASNRSG